MASWKRFFDGRRVISTMVPLAIYHDIFLRESTDRLRTILWLNCVVVRTYIIYILCLYYLLCPVSGAPLIFANHTCGRVGGWLVNGKLSIIFYWPWIEYYDGGLHLKVTSVWCHFNLAKFEKWAASSIKSFTDILHQTLVWYTNNTFKNIFLDSKYKIFTLDIRK